MCVGVRVRTSTTVTQGVVGGVILWCAWGSEVCRSKRGLSRRVSLEVSSDVCTGGVSQYYSPNSLAIWGSLQVGG